MHLLESCKNKLGNPAYWIVELRRSRPFLSPVGHGMTTVLSVRSERLIKNFQIFTVSRRNSADF